MLPYHLYPPIFFPTTKNQILNQHLFLFNLKSTSSSH
uniref:Uncharacterized protein n=1 Tax=Arundo donax TaxID=35708 RepID=A0A0A9C348_ARUDO